MVAASPAVNAEIRSLLLPRVTRRVPRFVLPPTRRQWEGSREPSVFLNDRLDQFTVVSGLAHPERDGFVAIKSADDFAIDTVVESEFNLDQMNTIIAHDRHQHILILEDQSLIRNPGRMFGALDGNFDVGVHTRVQGEILVRQINFHLHGARGLVECRWMTRDSSGEIASGIFADG